MFIFLMMAGIVGKYYKNDFIMACIVERLCGQCRLVKTVDSHTFNGTCPECQRIKKDQERRKALAALKGLTIEERLANIERQLYDLPEYIGENFEPKHHKYA
jgi:hypothetical protein